MDAILPEKGKSWLMSHHGENLKTLCQVKSAGEGRTNCMIPLIQFPITGMESGKAISRDWEERGMGSFLKNCRFDFFHFSHSDLVVLESGSVSFPKLWKL